MSVQTYEPHISHRGSRARQGRFLGKLATIRLIVEIPDSAIEFENPGPHELQLKALGTAMNATWNQRVKYRELPILSLVEFGNGECQSCRLWSSQF